MKMSKFVVLPVARMALPLLAIFTLVACEEEKKSEPLPPLSPIEIPKDVPGLYSGSLPCDDCTSRMVRMTLAEDSSVTVVQNIMTDSVKSDTLSGKFSIDSGKVAVVLSEGTHWNFQVEKSGALSLLTGAGTVYQDENGMKVDLIRILNVPSQKNLKTEQ